MKNIQAKVESRAKMMVPEKPRDCFLIDRYDCKQTLYKIKQLFFYQQGNE